MNSTSHRARWLTALAVLFGAAPAGVAQTSFVVDLGGGGDFTSIQAAIDASTSHPDSEVVINPGVYEQVFDTVGKAMTIRSADPLNPAVITQPTSGPGASEPLAQSFGGEGPDTQIIGLTFRDADFEGFFLGPNASVRLESCVFENCGDLSFMAVRSFGSLVMVNCTVRDSAEIGVISFDDEVLAANCVFEGGGASHMLASTTGSITAVNCTFAENTSTGAAVLRDFSASSASTVTLNNCVLWNPGASAELLDQSTGAGDFTVSNCLVRGGVPAGIIDGGGNIDADPLFVDAPNGDFRLQPGSPALDRGRDDLLPTLVDLGIPNVVAAALYFDADGGSRVIADPALGATALVRRRDNPVPIPDNDPLGVEALRVVGGMPPIERLEVPIKLTHTWVSDLEIEIESPQGTVATLWNRACGDNDDINAVFGDGRVAPCVTPVVGPSLSRDPLAAFTGEDPNGTWRLRIIDHEPNDTGTLRGWGVLVKSHSVDMGAYERQEPGGIAAASTRLDPQDQGQSAPVRFRTLMREPVSFPISAGAFAPTIGSTPGATIDDVVISAGMSFDGTTSSKVTVPPPAGGQFDLRTTMTVEAWVNISDLSGNPAVCFTGPDGVSTGFTLRVRSDGRIELRRGNLDVHITSGSYISVGDWNHIAVTVDENADEVRFYLTGSLAETSPVSSSGMLGTGLGLTIGESFPGIIDELRVWDTVRTDTELRGNLMSRIAGDEPGLVACYRLDALEDLGIGAAGANDVRDRSLNGIHGEAGTGVAIVEARDFSLFNFVDEFYVNATTGNSQGVLGLSVANNGEIEDIFNDLAPDSPQTTEFYTVLSLACSPADITTQGAGMGDPGFGVPDGQITAADLNFFVNAFVASDASIADVTTTGAGMGDPGFGVPDGNVTATDLNFYVNLFVAGCP